MVVDWETYMDLHTAAGDLASACNAAERSGVTELVRMVHSEKPAVRDRLHTSYHTQMPEHGLALDMLAAASCFSCWHPTTWSRRKASPTMSLVTG